MTKFIAFVCLISLVSCTEHNGRELIRKNEKNQLDTLRFSENMRNESRLDFTWDKLTIDSPITRETWVKIKIKGINGMSDIVNHSNLFLKSEDTLLEVQKISNSEFKIKVYKEYSGYKPSHGGKCIIVASYIQPKKGYIFESYWLDKGITYPSWTKLFLHYVPIEEK